MNSNVQAIVRWSKVICKQPQNYIGWPTIARRVDGELLVVFSGDREGHNGPYGKTQLVRSQDEGLTWSETETINNFPFDDRDAGIIVLRSGTIILSWFMLLYPVERIEQMRESYPEPDAVVDSWIRHGRKIQEETILQWNRAVHGHKPRSPRSERTWVNQASNGEYWTWRSAWTRRSTDGGHTWEPPVDSIVTTPHGPIELLDGRLIYVGNDRVPEEAPKCVESTDEGRSWHEASTIPMPEGQTYWQFIEPHVVEVGNGRLLCLSRHSTGSRAPNGRYLYQCESTDSGMTWSVPHPMPMWGYPPHLIRLHTGDLLASYGHRRPPYGQRACLSHDGGQTWDIAHEIVLRDDAPSDDLGYPATVELSPGELATVYYQIDQPGEKTSLMLTRWSLE